MSARLVMTFAGYNGDVTFSYGYAKESATTNQVKSLMNGLITNGSIFFDPPLTMKSAKMVITNTDEYDLSD